MKRASLDPELAITVDNPVSQEATHLRFDIVPSVLEAMSDNIKVTNKDFEFYKEMQVPPPTLCSFCRMIRRLSWRTERFLYHRTCDLTGKQIISAFSPEPAQNRKYPKFPVYDLDAWWSDKWDPLSYGQDYDFSRPFFDQFFELQSKVPRAALQQQKPMENSTYCNAASHNKNCYLMFSSNRSEDCYYGSWVNSCRDCIDNTNLIGVVFDRACLNNTTFSHTDLSDAKIIETEVKNVKILDKTKLHRIHLVNLVFLQPTIQNADFSEAQFTEVYFLQAVIENSKLVGIHANKIFFDRSASLRDLDLSHAHIEGLVIRGSKIIGPRLNFEGAEISKSCILGQVVARNASKSERTAGLSEDEKGHGWGSDLIRVSALFTGGLIGFYVSGQLIDAKFDADQDYAPANINSIILESNFECAKVRIVKICNIKFGSCAGICDIANTGGSVFYNVISSNPKDIEQLRTKGAKVNGKWSNEHANLYINHNDPDLGKMVTQLLTTAAVGFVSGGTSALGHACVQGVLAVRGSTEPTLAAQQQEAAVNNAVYNALK